MLDDPPARLIEDEVRAARAAGPLSGFAERVALNAEGIAARERAMGGEIADNESLRLRALVGHDGELATLNAALARQIRDGQDAGGDLVGHLVLTTIDKLRVDQPTYPGFAGLLTD